MPSAPATVDIDITFPSEFDLGCAGSTSVCSRCRTLALLSCSIDESGRHAVSVRMPPARRERNARTEPPPSISADMTSSSSSHQQEPATPASPQPTSEGQDANQEGGEDSPSTPRRPSTRAHYTLVPTDRSSPVPAVTSSYSDDDAEDTPPPRSRYWNGARTVALWRRLDERRRSGVPLDDAIHELQNEMYPLLPPSDYTIPPPGLHESLLSRLRRSYAPPRRAVKKRVVKRSETCAKPTPTPSSRVEPGWISILWDSIQLSPRKRKLERDTDSEDDDMTLVGHSDNEEDGLRGGKRRKLW